MAVTPPTIVGTVSQGRTACVGPGCINTTVTIAHTVASGTDALGVLVSWDTFFADEPIVTWLGSPIVELHRPPTGGLRASLYLLVNPTHGSGNVVVVGSAVHGTSLAAVAFNVANYAGVRFAEYSWTFSFDADPTRLDTDIYSDPTDLVLSFPAWYGQGITIAPDAGQTVLADQSGALGEGCTLACARIDNPVAVGNPAVQANVTSSGWDTSFAPFSTSITNYLLAIKGLDRAAPSGAPTSLGRVTQTVTAERQPTSTDIALADTIWRWRHEIPSTHRTLVVLVNYLGITSVTAVYYQPDGAAEIALTELVQSNAAGAWLLASAPVGLGYLRVVMSSYEWYGAAAFSIAGTNVVGDVFVGGVDPDGYVVIPSSAGQIVIDRVGQQSTSFQNWTAGAGGSGQTSLYVQPIVGDANVRTATSGTNQGASSWTTAVASTTTMLWTPSPAAGTRSQAAFAYTPLAPPELVEEVLPIRRLRRSPVIHQEDAWIFHKAFQLDLKTGIGLDGLSTVQGHDPQVMLRWSNNGGKTWSHEHWVSAGKIGQYKRRAMWRRLGRARNRVYEVVVSDPTAWQIVSAFLDVEEGTN